MRVLVLGIVPVPSSAAAWGHPCSPQPGPSLRWLHLSSRNTVQRAFPGRELNKKEVFILLLGICLSWLLWSTFAPNAIAKSLCLRAVFIRDGEKMA